MRHVFGPVPSRRLGPVLGIDLVPHKICTFDCRYCDLGHTTRKTVTREVFYPPEEILAECEAWLKDNDPSAIRYVSICGSGEPTLYQGLGTVVGGLKRLTETPLAFVTNGALLGRREVQEELRGVDLVLPSLDTVNEAVFKVLNRPAPSLDVRGIVSGLEEFRRAFAGRIWLEICLCRGINDAPSDLERLRDALERIRPDRVQLNTPVRAPCEDVAYPLSEVQMEMARGILGPGAEIIESYRGGGPAYGSALDEENLLEILRRHPATRSELKEFFPAMEASIDALIAHLVRKGSIYSVKHRGRSYYRAKG